MKNFLIISFLLLLIGWSQAQPVKNKVPDAQMQEIYEEVKTPFKYGLVMVPPDDSKKIDCPSVFRKNDTWYMTYLVFDGRGYETWLAKSTDLLEWVDLGRILSFSNDSTQWDADQKAGFIALQDYTWGGSYELQKFRDRYWMSYLGGKTKGYELGLLSIGIASNASDPADVSQWNPSAGPVMMSTDTDVRWWENIKQFKSTVIRDRNKLTGHPFVMFYNAAGDSFANDRNAERIGMAVSDDMEHWQRFLKDPVLDHHRGITGDPVIQKIGNIWVMFYFGAFWQKDGKDGAFNRFACSYDLVNWSDWKGENLVEPSEPYDNLYAHKSFVVKWNSVVYHFYCAVNTKDQRGIAVATSKDLGKSRLSFAPHPGVSDQNTGEHILEYKVGFLGIPYSTEGNMNVPVEWNEENINRLKLLGFNMVQINVAWGSRPADEPLNIEDVVELSADQQALYPQTVPLRCDPSPERREQRRAELRRRIELCRKAGMRTLFHFGVPYNAHSRYGDGPPNCISDPKVSIRYKLLLEVFARDFPGVDDILVYTYDQDAWLCSEFGPCPRCTGIPLHKRLVPFLDQIAATWKGLSPRGRLWWEPWELSAGQSLECVEQLNPDGFGLMLHCNTAEVMATLPVDRWFKNMCQLASKRGIPVVGEYFLGGASEELEPYVNLSHPLVTLRGLKALSAVPGISGIKEYYGLAPDREDPNLRMTGIFFRNPQINEEDALQQLAEPYGNAAGDIVRFWRLTSEGMELFPWETSWLIRQVGRSSVNHSMSAAILRGMDCPTPSWRSSRHSIFMRVEPEAPPDPWMLEDVQLRCELAANSMEQALETGNRLVNIIPQSLQKTFQMNQAELASFRRRALAYAYHLRETNIALLLRKAREQGQPAPDKLVSELLMVMKSDLLNFEAEHTSIKKGGAVSPGSSGQVSTWQEMADAIALIKKDADVFLKTYFLPATDQTSKGIFSVTSP